jgi:CRP/FNR family transcriptional regulator, cyclic AMP receptor protein
MLRENEIRWPCKLPDALKSLILASAKTHILEDNDYLLMGKDVENGLIHVIQGMVVVANTNLSRPCPFVVFKPGTWFGGLNVFNESHFLFKIISINRSKIIFIPHPAIRGAAKLSSDVYKFLYLMTVDNARETIEKLLASQGMQLIQKIPYLLLELSKCFPHVAGTKPMISMSQSRLAMALGISRITLNQQLHLLEQKRIIGIERKKVYLLDSPALEELANTASVSE